MVAMKNRTRLVKFNFRSFLIPFILSFQACAFANAHVLSHEFCTHDPIYIKSSSVFSFLIQFYRTLSSQFLLFDFIWQCNIRRSSFRSRRTIRTSLGCLRNIL